MGDDTLVRHGAYFNYVIIIQSLKKDERQTGEELYQDIVSRRCEQRGMGASFIKVETRKDFFDTLKEIHKAVTELDLLPILHFEIHGTGEGFWLSGDEAVRFKEIAGWCRAINVFLKNELMVSLATCKGANFYKLINIEERAPYWGYIGPKDDINVEEVMRDFSSFYDTFLGSCNLSAALNALNLHHEDFKYSFLTAEMIFDFVVEQIKWKPGSKKKMFDTFKRQTKVIAPYLNRRERRKQLNSNIEQYDQEAYLRQKKNFFLMRNL